MPPLECPITEDDLNNELARIEALIEPATVDKTNPTAVGHPMVWGTSAGQVNKPWNIAREVADFDGANENLEVSYKSMRELFANEAAENTQQYGRMNSDGTLGYYKKRYLSTPTPLSVALAEAQGFHYNMRGDDNVASVHAATGYNIINIPDGRYDGQTFTVLVTGLVPAFIIRSKWQGVIRGQDYAIQHATTGSTLSNWIVRLGEGFQLTWNGINWFVDSYNNKQYYGGAVGARDHWYETLSGKVNMTSHVNIGAGTNAIVSTPRPVPILNPVQITVSIEDYQLALGSVVGDPNEGNGADWTFAYYGDASDGANAVIGFRRKDPANATTAAGFVTIHAHNGRLDYAALGL